MAPASGPRVGRIELLVVFLGALAGRAATAGHFTTIDEPYWMFRSDRFANAVVGFHPSQAAVGENGLFGSLATRPGVTTMWIGSAARAVWDVARHLGLWDGDRVFRQSEHGLAIAQLGVGIVTSALLVLLTWLLGRWASRRTALLVALLVATEPFWVAHGSVLHTDELTALFGTCGLLALCLALGVPHAVPGVAGRRRWAVAAGALLAGSCLTKVSGLLFAPGCALVVLWAVVVALRSGEGAWPAELRRPATTAAVAVAATVATVFVVWPALWVDPLHQLQLTRQSLDIGADPLPILFRGEQLKGGTPLFYLFALPFRMTPWLLAGVVVGVPVALARAVSRARAIVLLLATLPILVLLSHGQQQVDRYGLSILAPLCIAAALAVTDGRGPSRVGPAVERWAPAGLGVLALAFTLAVAPWGLAYYDPVLGGSTEAVEQVPVGWNEGQERAADLMYEHEHGRCKGLTWWGLNGLIPGNRRCGTGVTPFEDPTYTFIYVTDRQTMTDDTYRFLTTGRRRIATVRERGITYVEVWRTTER